MSGPRICVSLAASEIPALLAAYDQLSDVDLVEVRLDALVPSATAVDVRQALEKAPVDVLVTCRRSSDGGGFDGDEGARHELITAALDAGARYVDVELDAAWAAQVIGEARERVVLSHHWTGSRPDDIDQKVTRILELRPAVAKLVTAATAPDDALPMLAAGDALRAAGLDCTCFCMGSAGAGSRLADLSRGGVWSYASTPLGSPTAPGQWPAHVLRQRLRIERWGADHARYAVIGDPITHSLSPVVFNAAFEQDGRAALYMPLPGDDFGSVMRLVAAANVVGLSVTMPYKRQAADFADLLSPDAERMEAVNTLVLRAGRWEGHNTDGAALVEALSAVAPVQGKLVAVLGAGGAAAAAVVALQQAGAEVIVLGRSLERARQTAMALGCEAGRLDEVAAARPHMIVNATPVGMDGAAQSPIPTAWLRGDEVVLDMVYRPPETELLRQAQARGCSTITGLEMFLRQAAAQHAIWTGERAPTDRMRSAAISVLEVS